MDSNIISDRTERRQLNESVKAFLKNTLPVVLMLIAMNLAICQWKCLLV